MSVRVCVYVYLFSIYIMYLLVCTYDWERENIFDTNIAIDKNMLNASLDK